MIKDKTAVVSVESKVLDTNDSQEMMGEGEVDQTK
jgi:hypothetical protein